MDEKTKVLLSLCSQLIYLDFWIKCKYPIFVMSLGSVQFIRWVCCEKILQYSKVGDGDLPTLVLSTQVERHDRGIAISEENRYQKTWN